MENKESLMNVSISTAISIIISLFFYIFSNQLGDYAFTETVAGAVYSFVLTLVISTSLVPRLLKRFRTNQSR